ncbi:MAG: cytoplasmic protein [Lentisphaeria bacterium]|nr:cytoplasmic protein [Lentisphaeria bacterium]
MGTERGEPRERFVSEPIVPIPGSFLPGPMAVGEPGIPLRFRWRRREYEVARVLDTWKTTGACRNGSGERYVRRHGYRIETTDGTRMRIAFDRQPRAGRSRRRWWLVAMSRGDSPGGVGGGEGGGHGP